MGEGYTRPQDTEPHHALVGDTGSAVPPRSLAGEDDTAAWYGVERFAIPAAPYAVNLDLAHWPKGCAPESDWPPGGWVADVLLKLHHPAFGFHERSGRIIATVREDGGAHCYLTIAERPTAYFPEPPPTRTGDPFFAAHRQKRWYADGFTLLHFVDATGAVVSRAPEHAAQRNQLEWVVASLMNRLDRIREEMGE